jgi:glycosyltransferase involved in cell wall biosynthesis
MRVVGVMLLKNEDLFVRQALTNILDFCDEILVLDNMSTDGTQEIVKDIVKAHPHVRLRIVANAHDTQRYIAGYAGTDTWVFGVDGDEIYDASALGRMRKRLENGEFKDAWCVYG